MLVIVDCLAPRVPRVWNLDKPAFKSDQTKTKGMSETDGISVKTNAMTQIVILVQKYKLKSNLSCVADLVTNNQIECLFL